MLGKDLHDDTVYREDGTRNAAGGTAYQMARETIVRYKLHRDRSYAN